MSSQAASRPAPDPRPLWRRFSWGSFFAVAFLVVGAILMVAPFTWLVSTSLRPVAETFTLPPRWLPTEFDLTNYTQLFGRNVPLLSLYGNSAFISIVCAAGLTFTSAMAGYGFAKLRFPMKNALFAILLLALMVPVQVTIVPLFILMQNLGLVDTPWSLILPAVTGAFAPGLPAAFGIFMMRQFFARTPDSLLEAARIDGAGPWTTFFRIALPLAKPGIAALFVITLTLTWNDFFLPLVFLNSIEQMVLPVGIIALREPFTSGAWTLSFVALAILPVLVVFLISQRWIIDSFTRSGLRE
jgi:multiple sugar transport system permease protein